MSALDLSRVQKNDILRAEVVVPGSRNQSLREATLAVTKSEPDLLHCCFECPRKGPCLGLVFDRDTGIQLVPPGSDFEVAPEGGRILEVVQR